MSDMFDQRRIRLADIDGSGTTDIIYLSHDGIHLYFNLSGNSFRHIQTQKIQFPHIINYHQLWLLIYLGMVHLFGMVFSISK